MRTGIWKIPVPADAEPVIPDIVIAPLLGFDAQCYRLGNGGGYFDRTLPVLAPRWAAALREVGPGRLAPDTRLPRTGVIGVGHVCLEIRTIFPQPHDIAMDAVVTGTDWTRYKPHLFP